MIIGERMDDLSRKLFFDFFDKIISKRKIGFIPPNLDSNRVTPKTMSVDYRVEFLDAEHLSIAVSKAANVFVTLDSKLLRNANLEREFKIKILHPKLH